MNHIIPWGKVASDSFPLKISISENRSVKICRDANEIVVTEQIKDAVYESRYITGDEHSLFLEPGLPELPVILKPTQKISILPSRRMDVFVEVPAVIRILYGSQHKQVCLCEVNMKSLSRSFFGNSENGEFAYFLESPLFRNISEYENKNESIYCPLTISNKSAQNLEFEKMIFRAPYLSIYFYKKELIASPVVITFRGQEQISQISYKKSSPISGSEIKPISIPRMEDDKNILKRSFYFIKNLYTG